MSRIKCFLALSIAAALIATGCANDKVTSPVSPSNIDEASLQKRLPNKLQKDKALKIAADFILSDGVLQTNSNWAQKAQVIDAFPIYLDGVDEVSYYECKVSADGVDAGYVLVNINKTDVIVPEYNTEGKTQAEQFAEVAGTNVNNLQFFRSDWFKTLAELKTSIGLGDGVVLVERGYDGSGIFHTKNNIDQVKLAEKRSEYRRRVQESGGVNPLFTKDGLIKYYSFKDSLQMSLSKSSAVLEDRWTSDELNNTFSCGWHMPQWTQVTNATGMLSGCGPLGLTMMYAY